MGSVLRVRLLDGTVIDIPAIGGPRGENGKDGKDGVSGKDGADGKNGYTPVKGIDYYTETDKKELIAEIIASLPNGNEISY